MENIVLYALLTTAAFYLGSRAVITAWLWSRYPPKLARFFDCAACSGWWYGLVIGMALSWGIGISPLGIPATEWYSPIVIAFGSLVWTPILAAVMQMGLERLGSAVDDEAPP